MEYITLNNEQYLVMKNVREALNVLELENRFTDYFSSFDYIVGDWAYGKLRLKGFNSKTNPNFKDINDIDKVEEYLEKFCAFQCRYFILGKEKK